MFIQRICPICGQPTVDYRWYRLPIQPHEDWLGAGGHCCGGIHLPF